MLVILLAERDIDAGAAAKVALPESDGKGSLIVGQQ
jgi:hypothetical protein